jgi:hypothetical protein
MQKDCQSYCSPGKFAISVRESVIKSGSRIIGKKKPGGAALFLKTFYQPVKV